MRPLASLPPVVQVQPHTFRIYHPVVGISAVLVFAWTFAGCTAAYPILATWAIPSGRAGQAATFCYTLASTALALFFGCA